MHLERQLSHTVHNKKHVSPCYDNDNTSKLTAR